jgi:hypothetical protein
MPKATGTLKRGKELPQSTDTTTGTLAELGITKDQSSQWQKLGAKISAKNLENRPGCSEARPRETFLQPSEGRTFPWGSIFGLPATREA